MKIDIKSNITANRNIVAANVAVSFVLANLKVLVFVVARNYTGSIQKNLDTTKLLSKSTNYDIKLNEENSFSL